MMETTKYFELNSDIQGQNRCAIISIHSPSQKVLEYPQKHALILQVQKLYQARPANSTGHDYLGLVQFELVDTYFFSK